MAFIDAIIWFILALAVLYGAINLLFCIQITEYERRVGAYDVWIVRLVKSIGVAIVAILWLIFG